MRIAEGTVEAEEAVDEEANDGRDTADDALDAAEPVRWCGLDALGTVLGAGAVLLLLRPFPAGGGDFPPLADGAEEPWRLLVRWRELPEWDEAELTDVDEPAASVRAYGGWKGPPRQSPGGVACEDS